MKKHAICVIAMIFMLSVCFPAIAGESSIKETAKTTWTKTKDGAKKDGKEISKAFKKETKAAKAKAKKDAADAKKKFKSEKKKAKNK